MLGVFTRTMGRVGRVARESGPKAQNHPKTWKGAAQGLNDGTTTARGHARGRGSPLYFTRIAAAPRGSLSARARPHTDWGVERLQEWSRSTSAANEAH